MAIIMRDKSSIYNLVSDLQTLQAADATEKARAEAAEAALTTAVTNEVTRATAAETANTTAITAEVTRATGEEARIEGLITAEVTRAEGAEEGLSDRIDVLEASADLTALTTDDKTSLVAAINEVDAHADTNAADIDVVEGRLDVLEGDDTTVGSVAKAQADAEDYADGILQAFVDGDFTTLETLVNTINGDATTAGSFRKEVDDRIEALINSAPAALDTLGEIAAYIDASPDANVLDAIQSYVTAAKDELKGSVSTAFDTLEEVEAALEIINGDDTTAGSIAKAQADAEAYADTLDAAMDLRVDDLEAAVGAPTGLLADLTTDDKTNLVAAINEVDANADTNATNLAAEITRATAAEGVNATAIAAEVTRATAAEGALDTAKMAKASNLSDLADKAVSRTNLDVFSKAEVTAAITAGGATPIAETLTVAGSSITLTNAPKNGINGIMNFMTVRYTNANGVSFDAPVVATGDTKVFTISTDTADQWDGFSVTIQYLYSV
jgi:hypothetical protein